MQGFAMVVGKDGIKMEPAGPFELPENMTLSDLLNGDRDVLGVTTRMGRGAVTLEFTKMPAPALAYFAASFLRVPVADETNLSGAHRGRLTFSLTDNGPSDPDQIPLTTAITELGLRLESRKVPVEIIVVDSASRTPTEN